MPLEVTIRQVAPGDYTQWFPLWQGYNKFYGRHGDTALPEAITQATWSRFLDPNEPVHALVAEQDGQLIGLVHYLYHRTTLSISLTCYLHDLFTTEAARGQGIGKKLIEAVYEEARKAGAFRVYWLTHETNETAMQLYNKVAEKSGFLVYRKFLE
jgi:GNAT superfamily N-acetyltransferase